MIGAMFTVPLIIFMVVVAPIWLGLHYWSKRKASDGLSEEDLHTLNELAKQAERLQQRVTTLEKILDSESPSWRNHYE